LEQALQEPGEPELRRLVLVPELLVLLKPPALRRARSRQC
jgi:hypothetical protein